MDLSSTYGNFYACWHYGCLAVSSCADPENSFGAGHDSFFQSSKYFTEGRADLPEEGVSVSVYLRKPIATCDFSGGGVQTHCSQPDLPMVLLTSVVQEDENSGERDMLIMLAVLEKLILVVGFLGVDNRGI